MSRHAASHVAGSQASTAPILWPVLRVPRTARAALRFAGVLTLGTALTGTPLLQRESRAELPTPIPAVPGNGENPEPEAPFDPAPPLPAAPTTPSPERALAQPEKPPLELELSANRQSYDSQRQRFVATGNVMASVAGGRLLADRLEFDTASRTIYASGSVRFKRGQQYLQASRLRYSCLLYTSPSPRDATLSRMPSSA